MGAESYKQAGVDTAAAARLVDAIKPLAQATSRPGVLGSLGGFGGLFDPAAAGWHDPLLVAATDGVGTKLRIAILAGCHDHVGVDLVAMCVNDLVVQGAEPLFFLDYFATGRLATSTAEAVIAGIARGCSEAGCALIGGETAEMPGMYAENDYDLAGFAVGAVERPRLLPQMDALREGDVLLGLESSGLHSNGFSLVRRLVERQGLAYDAPAPFAPEMRLDEALLQPTRLYVRPLLATLKETEGAIKAMSHITGGGFPENLPRMLPPTLSARIEADRWPLPPVFPWLARTGAIPPAEMLATFNCGIGMVLAVDAEAVAAVEDVLGREGLTPHRIGTLGERAPEADSLHIEGAERLFASVA